MSLPNFWERIKLRAGFGGSEDDIHFDEEGRVVRFPLVRKIWLTLLIVLVGTLGFGLGKLSNINQSGEIKIDYVDLDNSLKIENSEGEAVTASSKGTRYYYSWCKSTVSDKNKVSFASAIIAEKAGYTLAANCYQK